MDPTCVICSRKQRLVDSPSGHSRLGTHSISTAAKLEFLNPGCGPSDENINNDSLVLRMTYGRRSFLLTGDIEEPVEECLAALEAGLRSDVLKVAHHGSATSTSSHFLNEVNPVIAVISAGKVNPFGHPHPEVVRRLKTFPLQLLRTDRQGAVTIRTDGVYLRTSAFLEEGGNSILLNQ